MKENEIWNLFKGVAVIIDDGICEKEKSIGKDESADDQIVNIVHQLRNNNIVCVTYDDIPSEDVIKSMTTISFLIIDWKFDNIPQGTSMGEAFQKDNEQKVISFLEKFLENSFTPVFLFTNEETESIKGKLKEKGIYFDNGRNRVFVCKKSDVSTIDDIKRKIFNWMKQMPSVYVFKEWNRVVTETKNKLFIEMYGYSPNWIKVIYELLAQDCGKENFSYEFGNFITKQILTKAFDYNFAKEFIKSDSRSVSSEEIKMVLEGERYVKNDLDGNLPRNGDLYYHREKEIYMLNVTAQCDLCRLRSELINWDNAKKKECGQQEEQDRKDIFEDTSVMYFLQGKLVEEKEIAHKNRLKLLSESGVNKLLIDGNKIKISDDSSIWGCSQELDDINDKIKNYLNAPMAFSGGIFGKRDEYYLAYVNGGKIIKFELKIVPVRINENNVLGEKIGRVLEPYITDIQKKAAAHIVRTGLMQFPLTILNSFDC